MSPAWKELGFRSYDAYIKSRLWWNIRQIILERDGRCCQVCGSPSKTVHHIDYTQTIMLGQGDQHELITLCEPCHNFVEQNKRISEKKGLLNKLFGQHSKNTLDEWQIWAKQFNNDIGYSRSQILEPKNNNQKKKHNNKKKKPVVLFDKKTREKQNEQPQSELQSLRSDIDYYIKEHKKNKQFKKLLPSKTANKKYVDNKVRYYNRLPEEQIKKQLHQAFSFFIELLFNHPEANNKLKQCISPYLKKQRNNETRYQKKKRLEQQEIGDILRQQEYQKQKPRKRTALFGKLPLWTGNHKTKSFQGQSPLTKHIKEVKEQKGSRNDT